MKTSQLILTIIQVPLDYIMLIAAAITAYFLRFGSFVTDIKPVIYEMPLAEYIQISMLMAILWILIFALTGLYQVSGAGKIIDDLRRVFVATSIGLITIVFIIFLQRELFSSRFIILTAYAFSILYVSLARIILRTIKISLFKKNIATDRVLLIGSEKTVNILKEEIVSNPRMGITIVQTFSNVDKKMIVKAIERDDIDEIIVADTTIRQKDINSTIDIANEHNIGFRYAADLFGAKAANVDVTTIAGIPLLQIKKTALDGWGRVYKRLFDFIVSSIIIILLSPIYLAIILVIRLTSPGPAIYKNQRVGRKGEIFDTYKFRTMKIEYCIGPYYQNTDKALAFEKELIEEKSHREGPLYKISDDPRRTAFGKWLEKTSLDEIPQFFNVFLGNMSLVGPRPHQPREVEKYKSYHKKLLDIKPGITGLAQISGRSDLDFEDEAKLDIFYIENWSFYLDLAILVKTPFTLFKKRKFS